MSCLHRTRARINPRMCMPPTRGRAWQVAHLDFFGEAGNITYAATVEAVSKDYLDWYILTQVLPGIGSMSGSSPGFCYLIA